MCGRLTQPSFLHCEQPLCHPALSQAHARYVQFIGWRVAREHCLCRRIQDCACDWIIVMPRWQKGKDLACRCHRQSTLLMEQRCVRRCEILLPIYGRYEARIRRSRIPLPALVGYPVLSGSGWWVCDTVTHLSPGYSGHELSAGARIHR